MKFFYTITSIVIFVLISVLLLLGFGARWLPQCLTLSDRISLMQVAVEIVGFSLAIYAGWFVARQFVQSQLKPKLVITSENGKDVVELQRFGIARDAPVKVYVHNSGNGIGRYILIHLEFPPKLDVGLDEEDTSCGWSLEYNRENEEYLAYFRGPDDFICYRGFPLYAGKFRVTLEAGDKSEDYQIRWRILAEDMGAEEGKLSVKVRAITI